MRADDEPTTGDPAHAALDVIAREVVRWRAEGASGVVAAIAESSGLGGAAQGELLALRDDGERAGGLLGGLLDADIRAAAGRLREGAGAPLVVSASIDGRAARRGGFACGGRASALVQPLAAIPQAFWLALAAREPAVLVVDADGTTLSVPGESVPPGAGGALTAAVAAAAELLAGGTPTSRRDAETAIVTQTFHPGRRLVVVGEATVAHALAAQAAVLGWDARFVDALEDAREAIAELRASDAVVVLTHDAAIDAPALECALRGAVGYVGALGSRRTQARRAEALAALGVGAEEIASIYGPVGLDLAATTPAESALAICAEVLAAASGRPLVSLRDASGSIRGPRPAG